MFGQTPEVGILVWLLILVAGALYSLFVLQRPVVGLFAVVFIFFLPIRLGGFTLLQLVGVVTAGLVAMWFFRKRQAIVLGNIFIPLVLLGALIVISVFYTRNASLSVYFVRKWVFNMIFYLCLVNIAKDVHALKWVSWAFVAAAAANAVAAVLEYSESTVYYHRAEGFLENQNGLGILSVLGFPLIFYHYLYGRGLGRWIWLALCALPISGLVVSISRGSTIALVVTILFILVVERRRRHYTLLAMLLLILAVPLMPSYWMQRMGTVGSEVGETIPLSGSQQLSVRGIYNRAGLAMWKANPLLGVGIGNFGHYFATPEYNPGTGAKTGTVAHNIYIQVLAEFGTIGGLVLLWLVVGTVQNLRLARRVGSQDVVQWTYFGAIEAMAIAVAVTGASSGNLMGQGSWGVLGLAAASGQIARRSLERSKEEGEEKA